MGNSFEVVGGLELHGEITPQGAKNEALQIICATLLTEDKVVIKNIPDIRDVNKLIELLQHLGVHVEQTGVLKGEFTFEAKNINIDYLDTSEFKKQASALRGSITVSYTHLRAHETVLDNVCRLLLKKKKKNHQYNVNADNTRLIYTTHTPTSIK